MDFESAKELFTKIENSGLECEAGPLRLRVEWAVLKEHINSFELLIAEILKKAEESKLCIYHYSPKEVQDATVNHNAGIDVVVGIIKSMVEY